MEIHINFFQRDLLLRGLISFWISFLILLPGIDTAWSINYRAYEVAQRRVEELTGRDFLRDVPLKTQSRDGFQQYFKTKLNQQFGGDELRNIGRTYYLLGLLPGDFSLEKELSRLYRDQVGAYYDPSSKTIYQLDGDLNPIREMFLYIHESVHALQDQHYGLESRQQRLMDANNLDQQLAFAFVVEGHANLIATAAQMNAQSLNPQFFKNAQNQIVFDLTARMTDLTTAQFQVITRLFGRNHSPTARSLENLQNVPLILVQQIADPYLVGQQRWFQRGRKIGWAQSEEWMKEPPDSTRDFFYQGDLARKQELPGDSYLTEGEYDNSLGTYLALRWLQVFRPRPNWGARLVDDRAYLLETGGDTGGAVIWFLRFQDEQALREFESDFTRFLEPMENYSAGYRFKRESERRFAWYGVNGSTMLIYMDDDPLPQNELNSYPRWQERIQSTFNIDLSE